MREPADHGDGMFNGDHAVFAATGVAAPPTPRIVAALADPPAGSAVLSGLAFGANRRVQDVQQARPTAGAVLPQPDVGA